VDAQLADVQLRAHELQQLLEIESIGGALREKFKLALNLLANRQKRDQPCPVNPLLEFRECWFCWNDCEHPTHETEPRLIPERTTL
jgi:hypothetical protein